MKLANLLEGIPDLVSVNGDAEIEIQDICVHSGLATPGSLFIAIRGFISDGHDFISDALENGSAAIAGEDPARLDQFATQATTILTSDARAFAARCAARFFDYPSRRLTVVGVTGTNGKTTTCYLTEAILSAAGLVTALLTTVRTAIGQERRSSRRTTPDAVELQSFLRQACERYVTHAVLEVSSHGIALSRTLGCEFDVLALTNVTQDHLDFHVSFDDYLATKLRLFTDYVRESAKKAVGVINLDDPAGMLFKQKAVCPIITCGATPGADYRVLAAAKEAKATRLWLQTPDGKQELVFSLFGQFNITNAVMAAAMGRALGLTWDKIAAGLALAKPPPGRLEQVDAGQPFLVFVDYAHTPDGLRRALEAVRGLCEGRVIVVFGCGGDRDKGKRPLMGEIAASQSDLAIVTSDNSRSEDPSQIIAEILPGMKGAKPVIEPDRERAIGFALQEARESDAVLIAGKGHETYQILKDRTIHFSDQEVARKWLQQTFGTKESS